jgi:MFS family permease
LKSPVETLIDTAARRRILVASVQESAVALGAVLAGTILLLLLGTQILNWPWLVLLAAIGLGIAFKRVRRDVLSRYRVAQIIDRRLQSYDLLSTAWFLLQSPGQTYATRFVQAQIETAERAATGVEPNQLFPLERRRSWAWMGALAA